MQQAPCNFFKLRRPERIDLQYKITAQTYTVFQGAEPSYLRPLTRDADVSGRRTLQSTATSHLVASPFKLSTIGSQVFPVAAPWLIWNALPDSVVSASCVELFIHHLKVFFDTC